MEVLWNMVICLMTHVLTKYICDRYAGCGEKKKIKKLNE